MKQFWSKLKISRKLIITFLIIALISSCPGIFSLYLMKSADTQYSEALVNYGFSQGDIGLLMSALKGNTANILMTIATDDEKLISEAEQSIQENTAKINTYMDNVKGTLTGDEEIANYKVITDHLPEFTRLTLEIVALGKEGKDAEAMNAYQGEALEHINLIEQATQNLMNSNQTVGIELSDKLTGQANLVNIFMTLLIIANFVISIVLATIVSRSISRPIEACSKRIVSLSAGNLKEPVPVVNSEDETGILAGATDEIVTRLQSLIGEMITILEQIADGNLNVDYTKKFIGDFLPLHTSSSKIIDSLNDAFRQLNHSSDQVASSAEQVSDGAQSLSQGTTEQASSIEELASTINEIASQVELNAEHAQEARKESDQQGVKMEEGSQKMGDMVQAMNQINNKSGEIGKIIKAIEDIAFQTNILALNAAVEAARAGEAGKGFAVVADEVRSLAGKSSEAAKDTAVLIEETVRAVEDGTSIANDTAESLNEVVTSSKHVAEIVGRIAEASAEQSSAINQVKQGVDQIASVVQTNSATSEESAAASQELAGQAEIMKELINHFRLKS